MGAMAAAYPLVTSALVSTAGAIAVAEISKPKTVSTPTPTVTQPKTMPTPGDAADKAAKRMSLKQQRERQGRASTILTDSAPTGDKLGT